MPTTTNLSVTFDGVNDVPRLTGQNPVEWFDEYISYYSVHNSTADDILNSTAMLTGSDWTVKVMRFGASFDNLATITDMNGNAGRRIDFLELGYNSDVDLISTRVKFINGWDGDEHDIVLGAGNTESITLYAAVNNVTTGSGYVSSIVTGGEDTIVVGSGSVGTIRTGNGDAVVRIGANYADYVRTRDGNDKVTVGAGWVETASTGNGNDTVGLGAGGAGVVRTGNGNDKVNTAAGWVELISTGEGKDVVNVGAGGAGIVRLSGGDDMARVTPVGPDGGYIINGGGGSDTLDFSKFTAGVTFTLDGFGVYQNVTAPGSLGGGDGWFAETGVENLIGTAKGDRFTGDAAANDLKGKNGNDRLFGGEGNDRLDGGNNNDRLSGDEGRDVLIGGKGQDVLEGGRGNDVLRGNSGADVFVFGANSGTDKVFGYADDADSIRLVGHTGGFADLTIVDQGGDLKITHDGGTILLVGDAGLVLTASDFDFV